MRNSVKVSKYQLVEYDIPHRLRHNLYSILATPATTARAPPLCTLGLCMVEYIIEGLCQQSSRVPVMSEQD